jgi:hypothetical protein
MSMCGSEWLVSIPAIPYRDQGGRRNMSELIVNTNKNTVEEAKIHVDPTWKGVYRAGGICMFVTGLLFIIGAVLSILLGPAPIGGEPYLRELAAHALLAQMNFGLFALTDFLLLPVVMALYLALKQINKNAMLVAAGLIALFIVLDLAITELNALTLVTLTQHYAAATSDTQRSAYVAAADYALATLPLATFYSYVVSSVGFLIISIVMLKGVFSKLTAYVGIVASIEGIVGGFYVVLPALAVFLVPCLIAFGIWSLLAGTRLYKLSKQLGGV